MAREPTSSIYLRFAAGSLLITTLVAATSGLVALGIVASSQERAAAHTVAGTVGTQLQALFDGPAQSPPADIPSRADVLTRPLLDSAAVLGVRISSAAGATLYEAGSLPDNAAPNRSPLSWQRASDSAGRSLFVTYVSSESDAVEVALSPASLDASIATAQRTLLALIVLCALLGFALLQPAFWLTVHRSDQSHRQLLKMYNTGDRLRSSLDLHEVVTHLSREVTTLAHGTHGLIALFDETTNELILHASYVAETATVTHHQRASDDWFMRRCAATNTVISATEPASAYKQFIQDDIAAEQKMHVLCVPVSRRDKVAGVALTLRPATSTRAAFTAAETARVEEIAGQAVMVIEQAQLFAKVRRHGDEIEVSYDATLKALMAALDAKDEVTEGHCERVAKLTIQLAKHMGIAGQQLVDIERGALLHDVGKIGVPDEVLRKPDALNAGEWEAMRKHPLLASLMVSKIGFLEGALPILLYHHERYDGDGYPFGLTGSKIPLEARIFSIIDAYDAMTSNRPYRDAMDHAAAIAEIDSNSGRQFDPDVVTAFIALMVARPELQHHAAQTTAESSEIEEEQAAPPAEAA